MRFRAFQVNEDTLYFESFLELEAQNAHKQSKQYASVKREARGTE